MTAPGRLAPRRSARAPFALASLLLLFALALLGILQGGGPSARGAIPPPLVLSGNLPGTSTPAPPGSPSAVPSPLPTDLPPSAPPASAAPTRAGSAATPTVAPAPPIGFGISTHLLWYELDYAILELDRIAAAGLTTVRFDIGWRWLEPDRKGNYDPTYLAKIDAILQAADARGLTTIITVIETPAWARPADTGIFRPPTNRQDYADALAMLATRYAERPGMIWEIWNEPNLPEFWEGGPNAADYADLLKRAHRSIKAADPDATVLGGSIVFNDLKFLRGMYENGARGSFDGLAHHPYAPGRSPDDRRDPGATFLSLDDMHAVMAVHGDGDKTIWITELGWSTELVTDAQRAAYLQRAVELVRARPYVRAFCVYTLRQDSGLEGALFGLITPNGVPTQSWEAYIKVAGKK